MSGPTLCWPTKQTCIKVHMKVIERKNHYHYNAPSLLSTILDLSVWNSPEVIYIYMSFKHEKRKNDTELSKHLWALRAKNKAFTITWRIFAKAKPYSNATKRCGLCTSEKHLIVTKPHLATLNK